MKANAPIAGSEKDKNPEDKTATANFRFGKDTEVKPKMSNVAMDTEVTITLKGKITSFEHDPNSNWNKDTRFGLTMTSCKVEKNTDNKETSLDDALENEKESRRKM
jgi:hypothetical protein